MKLIKNLFLLLGLSLPLLIYLNRFLLPDTAYDTINYHLFIGSRGFKNWLHPFSSVEFFPTGIFNFTPFHETIFYIAKLILGYRLGNIINLFAYFLITILIYQLIKVIAPNFFRSGKIINLVLFLNVIFVNELMFELATYYLDISNTLLNITGLFLLINVFKELNNKKSLRILSQFKIYIANFCFGLALCGKITNVIYIAPILFFNFWILFKSRYRNFFTFFLSSILLLGLFIIPLYNNFKLTSNPIFPFYNGLFRSKFYPSANFYNGFGGKNLFEKIGWPIFSLSSPSRLGEIQTLFCDFKLNLYWLVGMVSLFYFRRKFFSPIEKFIIIIFMVSFYSWSLVFGYLRYGIFLEILGSLVIIIAFKNKSGLFRFSVVRILVLLFLILQNTKILYLNLRYDYSWRPSFLRNPQLHFSQIKYLTANKISLPQNIQELPRKTDIIINCSVPSSGYYALSDFGDKPLVLLDMVANTGLTDNQFYRQKVEKRLKQYFKNKKTLQFAAIATEDNKKQNYDQCRNNLVRNNYQIINETFIDNFLGYTGKQLHLITGNINL